MIVGVIAHRLAVRRLIFRAEMAAAGFLAVEGIAAHKFAEFEEVGHASGFFEGLVEGLAFAQHADGFPEFLPELGNALDGILQAGAVAGHAAFVPDEQTEFAMETVHRAAALDVEHLLHAGPHVALCLPESGVRRLGSGFAKLGREVFADGVGNDEVAVGQSLHEGGGTEAIRTVVGKIGLAQNMQSGNVAHEVVVHPQSAHGIMHGRINAHRALVGVFPGDVFVHLEEVAVAFLDDGTGEPFDRIGEIEINAQATRSDAAALVAGFLGAAGGNVARGEVAVAGIFAFEEIIAGVLWDFLRRFAGIFLALGSPDPSVIAKGLAHEGELGLVFATDRNAGRVDLGVAGVGEQRAAFVSSISGRNIAALGVGREIEHVAVSAGTKQDGIAGVAADFARHHVAHDDALGVAVHQDEVEHFGAGKHLDRPGSDLSAQSLIGAEQKLLSGLSAGVERAGNLGPAEGAIGQQSAVFAGEGDALRDALVDNGCADFGQTIDVGLAGAEVAALDRVVEKTVNAVAVVLIIFCGVDPALRSNGVGAARAVLVTETLNVETLFAQGGGGRTAGQSAAHNENLELSFVGRTDELGVVFKIGPLLVERAGGDFGVKVHCRTPLPRPKKRMETGMDA